MYVKESESQPGCIHPNITVDLTKKLLCTNQIICLLKLSLKTIVQVQLDQLHVWIVVKHVDSLDFVLEGL